MISDTPEMHANKTCGGPMFCSLCHEEFVAEGAAARRDMMLKEHESVQPRLYGLTDALKAENAALKARVAELERVNTELERQLKTAHRAVTDLIDRDIGNNYTGKIYHLEAKLKAADALYHATESYMTSRRISDKEVDWDLREALEQELAAWRKAREEGK